MTELSGLDLRKAACEAYGMKRAGMTWIRFSDGRTFTEGSLPAIESDPAVSEPMFLEWCAKRQYGWDMCAAATMPAFGLSICNYERTILFSVHGATPSEARARAIVDAAKEPA